MEENVMTNEEMNEEAVQAEAAGEAAAEAADNADKSLEDRITDSLKDINQILAMDGGGIELVQVTDDMTAQVRLLGHCVGCMGARMTMSGIVEQILQDQVPEIKNVEAVD